MAEDKQDTIDVYQPMDVKLETITSCPARPASNGLTMAIYDGSMDRRLEFVEISSWRSLGSTHGPLVEWVMKM